MKKQFLFLFLLCNVMFAQNPVANPDTFTISNAMTGTTTQTVWANDTVGGVPITAITGFVTTALGTPDPMPASGGITLNANGTLTVLAGTPTGTYIMDYEICRTNHAGNCGINMITIIITCNAILVANPNSFIYDSCDTYRDNVKLNDTMNGTLINTATPGIVVQEISGSVNPPLPAGSIEIATDGYFSVNQNVPAGTYTINYKLILSGRCGSESNIATVTINVLAPPTPQAFVVTNAYVAVTPGTTSTDSALDNDTIGGLPATSSNVVISTLASTEDPGIIVNANGTVTVDPTVSAGEYSVAYKICQYCLTSNCSEYRKIYVSVVSGRAGGMNVKADETLSSEAMTIYPNPSSGIFNIQLNNQDSKDNDYKLTVLNPLGQTVIEKTINQNNAQIDLSNFESGTYFLKLQMGEEILNKVIIKK